MSAVFSSRELERLSEIKNALEERVNAVAYTKRELDGNASIEERSKQIREYCDRRDAFLERWKIYKYHLYQLVAAKDWREQLEEWIALICREAPTPEHYHSDLYALFVYVSSIINSQPYHLSLPQRMIHEVYAEAGYERGIPILTELLALEKDNNFRSAIERELSVYEVFDANRKTFFALASAADIPDAIEKWINTNRLSAEQAYDVLCAFNQVYHMLAETQNNTQFVNALDYALEILWKEKQNR